MMMAFFTITTPPPPPITPPQQLSPLSRPLEDCAGCPALAGVRNLGLDDPSAGCPDSHCNSGDRRIRACRAAAPLSQFPQAGPPAFILNLNFPACPCGQFP